MRSVAVLVAFLLLPIFALAQSRLVSPPQVAPVPSEPPSPSVPEGSARPPQEQRSGAQQPSAREQRGTEDNPLIVRTLLADKTTEERAQEKTDHDEKATADWWMRVLTGALVGVGLLQLLAFIGQIIVFVRQARSLRDSVNELRRATAATETTAKPPRPRRRALMRPSEQPKPCPKSSEPMFLAEAKLGGEMDNTILDISGSMLIITVKRRERLSG
jgi:hypothetical protein